MLRLPIMISLALYFALNLPQGDFAIRDHDTVVFLGDSIPRREPMGRLSRSTRCCATPGRSALHQRRLGWGYGGGRIGTA